MSADVWLAAVEARAAAAHKTYEEWDAGAPAVVGYRIADMAPDLAADLSALVAFARAVLALCDERENNGGRLVRIEPIRDLADQHLREPA